MREDMSVVFLEDSLDKEFLVRVNLNMWGVKPDLIRTFGSKSEFEEYVQLDGNEDNIYFIDHKLVDENGNEERVGDETINLIKDRQPNSVIVGTSNEKEFKDADFNLFVGRQTVGATVCLIIDEVVDTAKNK